MQKTQNYSLPQWEGTDQLKRGDFNTAMGDIDGALAAHDAALAEQAAALNGKANQSDLNATNRTVAQLAAQSSKIVFGEFQVNSSTTTGTILATFTPGAKLILLWSSSATPIVAAPVIGCRMFFESWSNYRTFSVFDYQIAAGDATDKSNRTIHYALIY